jgi:hypothetical protein
MGWQRSQIGALNREARGDRISPPGHDALLIRETIGAQVSVDGFQVTTLGKRHEVVSTRIAHQIFDTAFLPTSMHIGKERDLRDRHCGNAETPRARAGYVLAVPGAQPV